MTKQPTDRQLRALRYAVIRSAYERAKARYFEKKLAALHIVRKDAA